VTVRTCETLIRLATAHSKLRFSKRVETSDVDVAISMLKETIFNEQIDKKEAENVEMSDDNIEEDNKPNAPKRPTNLRALKAEAKPSGPEPGKKSKVDADEQVTQLFAAQPLSQPLADVHQKKIIFKIANAIKDSQSKCTLDQVWKRYMTMNERDTLRSGTNEPLVNNKEELMKIVEALEQDNLVMYAAEDNYLILM